MDELPTTNPYKTLNVPKDATLATIRSAHRKLVLSCHPDKVQDPAEKVIKAEQFHEVQKAYETLSDERKRQRYDESVKLAELKAERAEMMNERSTPRRTDEYYGPSRGGVPPRYDMYDGVRYEVKVPPSTPRTYDRDTFAHDYPEDRTSSRRYDDRYIPTSRKSSGRVPEDKRKTREAEDERERERRMKDNDREAYARDSRKRDKERRKDYDAKSSRKNAYVEDDDSDSELDRAGRYYKSKRDPAPKSRFEEARRRSGDEGVRKTSKRDSREYADSELESKTVAAKEHMNMNRSREAVDSEPSRRPTHARTTSKLEARTPPQPSHPVDDSGKRSSGRGRGGGRAASPVRSRKDRRPPEIIETPSGRKNSTHPISSASKGLKSFLNTSSSSRSGPQRSATYQHTAELRPKPLQRSETMPVDRMHRGDTKPLQTSTLRNMKATSDYSDSSSDSDSEMTEEIYPRPRRPSPRQKSTSYRYTANQGIVREPEELPPRRSEDSSTTRRPNLAPRGSTNRAPTTSRSIPHVYPSEERSPRQGYSRTDSARGPPPKTHQSPHLFRELSPMDEEAPRTKHSSPKMYSDEVRYADGYGRRGSDDPVDRDPWAGNFKRRPHIGRTETTVN